MLINYVTNKKKASTFI